MRISPKLIGSVVAIVFYAWGLQGYAVSWFDDFSDGDAGPTPVQWSPSPIFPGDYDASSGDYVLTPTDDVGQADTDDENLISTVNSVNFTDTSIRTRAVVGIGDAIDPNNNADFNTTSLVDGNDFLTWQNGFGNAGTQSQGDANSDFFVDDLDLGVWSNQYGGPPNLRGGNVGVMARFNPATGDGYLLVIDNGSQWNLLQINGFGAIQNPLNLDNNVPPIDPGTGLPINAETDIMIQLDVTGSGANTLLEVWFWKPEDPMPATPFFSVVDTLNLGASTINDGVAGIIYNEDDANTPGIFRSVEASDIHLTDPLGPILALASVPEPATGILAVMSVLAFGLLRSKRDS